ncbi:DUF4418 family protein [Pelosinus propionicus]|uniref:DUF4418 domain-containing protein n=1 Tax=Pelosinus propionicus DSM 13327 TaxID=1123291 RepID=A0A1I4GRR6_9FIRM|nr:DUF4418 family protein [Pelosinus propionicus]SFL31861.1 protein of unknown function [Pelosinus propionicus DSM 13327]
MKKYKLLSWIAVSISLFLLILPILVPICDGLTKAGSPMTCHYTYQAEFIITLIAVIVSAALLVLRTNEARLLAGFIIILLAISSILLPQSWAIGICENGSCLKTTFFLTIGASLLAVTGAGIVWTTWDSSKES